MLVDIRAHVHRLEERVEANAQAVDFHTSVPRPAIHIFEEFLHGFGDGVHVRADESSQFMRLRHLVPVEVEGREELVVERVHLRETRVLSIGQSCVDR